MMYKIITASNAVGALIALSFLVHFLHKKEYSKFYHFYIILQCSGLALLLSTSIYMFYKADESWVMRLFGLVYWSKTFVFIHSMKKHYGDTLGGTNKAQKLSDDNTDEAKHAADERFDKAQHAADDRFDKAKKVADDRYDNKL